MSILLQIVLNIIIILLTTLLTTFFAFRRFRTERWWEYKAKFYEQVVEALHHINKYFDYEYTEYINSQFQYSGCSDDGYETWEKERAEKINDPDRKLFEKIIKEKYDTSLIEIERIINISEFIIAQKATKKLIKLKDEWEKPFLDYEEVEDKLEYKKKLINSCLRSIKKIRKNDLSNRRSLLP